jgi:hypothetical protein
MLNLRNLNIFACVSLLALQACQQTKDALGISRHQPDEFRIMTRPTLRTPTSTDLKKPEKGTLSPFAVSPEAQAQRALGVKASDIGKSHVEKKLLERAKASEASQNIRKQVEEEDQAVTPKDAVDPWAQKVFYWHKQEKERGAPLDPQEEYERLHGKKHVTDINKVK